MTDTERKYPLSDAALLTATDDELHADWSTRSVEWHRLGTGAAAAQRDAIVRAATAKVRAEYEAKLAAYRDTLHDYDQRVGALQDQLATARTDGAREALTRLAERMRHGQANAPPNVPWYYHGVQTFRDREYPAPREEAVTDVLDLAVWGKGPDGEDIPCNLRLTPKDAAAIVTLARVAGREP